MKYIIKDELKNIDYKELFINLIDAIFSVIISYLFISTFGIHGATIGYTSTMVLHVILYTIYFLYEYSKLVKSED